MGFVEWLVVWRQCVEGVVWGKLISQSCREKGINAVVDRMIKMYTGAQVLRCSRYTGVR